MIELTTPAQAKREIALNLRKRRLSLNLTQVGLSQRFGVALATLRKFEQSGEISIDKLLKTLLIVGGLNKTIDTTAPEPQTFSTIKDVISGKVKPERQRGLMSS
ncbi:MAG: helix-turn-helix transcriptional regulator [Bacteroidetes bacterium]|nr:helix-turn-helix transcriptional regulator [Bacteroidota bacterium]